MQVKIWTEGGVYFLDFLHHFTLLDLIKCLQSNWLICNYSFHKIVLWLFIIIQECWFYNLKFKHTKSGVRYMFNHWSFYSPTFLGGKVSLFKDVKRFCIWMFLCSETSVFNSSCIHKVLCLEGSVFRGSCWVLSVSVRYFDGS